MTTSIPSTSPPTATAADAPMPGLVTGVPAIEGYSIAPVPADDVLWRVYELPPELTLSHGLIVGGDGVEVGRLIVASAPEGRSAIDIFVEASFANPVLLPASSMPMPDGATAFSMSATQPVWTEMEGNAVLRVEQEGGGNFQWAWGAGDLVFIVRGPAGAEFYVRLLQRVHARSLAPNDQQGTLGNLWDHRPDVAGYHYFDLFRTDVLANLDEMDVPDHCGERFNLSLVFPDEAGGPSAEGPALLLTLFKVGGWCVSNGFLDAVAGVLADGRRAEQIGGLTVYRDDYNIGALVGDVVITLSTNDPLTFVEMAAFIEPFFAAQPR